MIKEIIALAKSVKFISNLLKKKIEIPFIGIENTKYYGISDNKIFSRYKDDYFQKNQITFQIYNISPTLNIPIVNNADTNGALQKIEFRISNFKYDLDPFINIYFDGYSEFTDLHDNSWHDLVLVIENNGWSDAIDLQLKFKNDELFRFFKKEISNIYKIPILKSKEKIQITFLTRENLISDDNKTISYPPTREYPHKIHYLEFEVLYKNNQLESTSKYITSDTSKTTAGYSIRQYLEFNLQNGFYTPKAQIGGGGGYSNLGIILIDDYFGEKNNNFWTIEVNPTRILNINEVDLLQVGLITTKSSNFQLQIVFVYNKNTQVYSKNLNINIWNPCNSKWDYFLDKKAF
jgi:hypothetical protein